MEAKKRTCQILKSILLFIGMIEKVEDPTKIQMGDEVSPSLGLKWCFPYTDELIAELSSKEVSTGINVQEKDYFEERRKVF